MRRKGILLALGVVLSALLASGVAAAGTEVVVGTTLLEALGTLVDFLNALISALGDVGINPELPSGTSTSGS